MNKYEFKAFANKQIATLRNSYIDIDYNCIEVQTKKNLYRIISNKIERVIRSIPNRIYDSDFNFLNVVTSIKYKNGDFVYSYAKDLPLFKVSALDHLEVGVNMCFLAVLVNGNVYTFNCEDGDLLYVKFEKCPNLYYPKELNERISTIILPILNYSYDVEDIDFCIEYINAHLPFHSHELLNRDEEHIINNWEFHIKECPTIYLNRFFVAAIKKYLIKAVEDIDYNTHEWNVTFSKFKKEMQFL